MYWLLFASLFTGLASAENAAVAPAPVESPAAKAPSDDGEYEIDYEEEAPEEEEAPAKASTPGKKRLGGGPAVQGSRAKHRFEPVLKSETKSVYKKDGKPLDVDTD